MSETQGKLRAAAGSLLGSTVEAAENELTEAVRMTVQFIGGSCALHQPTHFGSCNSQQWSVASELPNFPLFIDPVREGVFVLSDACCSACQQHRAWVYSGESYGNGEEASICPWCIHDGTAASQGITFNDGTIYPCLPSSPQLSSDDRELVEQRTPGFVTWQGNHWVMCCGRACVYLGEAKAGDLQGRWKQAAKAIFEGDDLPEDRKIEILNAIGQSASPAAYIFQCQICKRLLGYWDCD